MHAIGLRPGRSTATSEPTGSSRLPESQIVRPLKERGPGKKRGGKCVLTKPSDQQHHLPPGRRGRRSWGTVGTTIGRRGLLVRSIVSFVRQFLVDPGVSLICELGDERQVITAKGAGCLPLVVLLVNPEKGDVVTRPMFRRICPDRSFAFPQPNLMDRSIVRHRKLLAGPTEKETFHALPPLGQPAGSGLTEQGRIGLLTEL